MAFAVISAAAQVRAFGHGGPFEKTSTWQMLEAREAYESGGVPKLKAYLDRIDRAFPDRASSDRSPPAATGNRRGSLRVADAAKQARPLPWPFGMFSSIGHRGEQHVMVAPASAASPYRWIVVAQPMHNDPWNFLPYYLLVFRGDRAALLAAGGESGVSFAGAGPHGRPFRPRRPFRARSFAAAATRSAIWRAPSMIWRSAWKRC